MISAETPLYRRHLAYHEILFALMVLDIISTSTHLRVRALVQEHVR
jgi:hypothetical protein